MDPDPSSADEAWLARNGEWSRRLGRIQLGVEPLADQLARLRRVTITATAMLGVLAAVFIGLFATFGRPGIGLLVALLFPAPLIAAAWTDDLRLRRLVRAYEADREAHDRTQKGPKEG